MKNALLIVKNLQSLLKGTKVFTVQILSLFFVLFDQIRGIFKALGPKL